MSKEKSGNGFITFLLILIILIMLIFGAMLTGLVKVNGPIITLGNSRQSEESKLDTKTTTSIDESSSGNSNVVATNNTTIQDAVISSNNNTMVDNTISNKINDVPQKTSVASTQILSYYESFIANYTNDMYSVVDINGDKIPELMVFTTGTIKNQIIAYTSIYTYDENLGDKTNNYIVCIGNIHGRIDNNTVLYKMNDGRLLSVYGHMGYESTAYYKIVNDWLVREEFSNREVEEGNDYIVGDTEIIFKKTSDKSLIKNYKD